MLPLTPMAGTWELLSSEGEGLVLLIPDSPDLTPDRAGVGDSMPVRLEPEMLGVFVFFKHDRREND